MSADLPPSARMVKNKKTRDTPASQAAAKVWLHLRACSVMALPSASETSVPVCLPVRQQHTKNEVSAGVCAYHLS